MPIFMMFGNYTPEGARGISAARTERVQQLVEEHGGEVRSMYAVMGEHDLVFILDFPDVEQAMLTAVTIEQFTGITLRTSPVVEVEKFDRLIGQPAPVEKI